MTTRVSTSALRGGVTGPRVAPGGARVLPDRLREESDGQVPFSQTRLLLREAASAIERLGAKLTSVTAELEGERAARRPR